MLSKDLIIINNEKISQKKEIFFCDNVDIKSISENLNKYFNVTVVARNSKIEKKHKIILEKVKSLSNIFLFLLNIFKTFKKKETIYLIVSITPYSFISFIFLFLFRKKVFVYLRSNGYEEYKAIFGFIGPLIYHLMFKTVTFRSNIISCQERLFTKGKSEIVFPSELDSLWLKNLNKPSLGKPKLLYIGRIKVEKGIFSLLKIFKEVSKDIHLSIVGKQEKETIYYKNVNYIGYGYDPPDLIKIYDNHNIFVLPSFTEAHPKVIDESLSRGRPVIIFEEIKHIIQNKKGIFVSKRNAKSFIETIEYIMNNYSQIQENMKKNKLPTKQEFILRMSSILNSN